MKWWFWFALKMSVIFGVGVWVYFYPNEILAKGVCGFAILILVGRLKEILNQHELMPIYKLCNKQMKEAGNAIVYSSHYLEEGKLALVFQIVIL